MTQNIGDIDISSISFTAAFFGVLTHFIIIIIIILLWRTCIYNARKFSNDTESEDRKVVNIISSMLLLHLAVMHLSIKFGADIFIQSRVIDIFPKFKMAAAAILIYRLCEFDHSGVLTVWYLSSVPYLVQISVTVTEIDALMLRTFIWWRHAN